MTSNGGLLAYLDLDYALGLFDSVSAVFIDKHTGRIIQHDMPTLLRQSIYSLLADYEDINDTLVKKAMSKTPHQRIILDMNSSESTVYGEQEGSACKKNLQKNLEEVIFGYQQDFGEF